MRRGKPETPALRCRMSRGRRASRKNQHCIHCHPSTTRLAQDQHLEYNYYLKSELGEK